jgi:hypothetical protein
MMLLTKANREALKPLYATDGDDDAKYPVKFFTPDGSATWFAKEFDGVDLFFGYVDLGLGMGCAELGYFSLSELQAVRGKMGLSVERDRHYTPKTLDELQSASVLGC